jgi:GNAT superfamily N-acetyltransferase
MEIRPLVLDDVDDVVRLWRESKLEAYPYVEAQQRHTRQEDDDHFRAVVCVECAVWVADEGGRLVGMLAIKGDYIDQLFVAVGEQRRGIGAALLEQARRLSPGGLRLHTFQRNARARAFYEKQGFAAVGFGISPAPESEPDVEYVWVLVNVGAAGDAPN